MYPKLGVLRAGAAQGALGGCLAGVCGSPATSLLCLLVIELRSSSSKSWSSIPELLHVWFGGVCILILVGGILGFLLGSAGGLLTYLTFIPWLHAYQWDQIAEPMRRGMFAGIFIGAFMALLFIAANYHFLWLNYASRSGSIHLLLFSQAIHWIFLPCYGFLNVLLYLLPTIKPSAVQAPAR